MREGNKERMVYLQASYHGCYQEVKGIVKKYVLSLFLFFFFLRKGWWDYLLREKVYQKTLEIIRLEFYR